MLSAVLLSENSRAQQAPAPPTRYAVTLTGAGSPEVTVLALSANGAPITNGVEEGCLVPCVLQLSSGLYEFRVSVAGQLRYRSTQRILTEARTLDFPANALAATPPVTRPIETAAAVFTAVGITGLVLGGLASTGGLIAYAVCAPSMGECLAERVVLFSGLGMLGLGLGFAALGTGLNGAAMRPAPRSSPAVRASVGPASVRLDF